MRLSAKLAQMAAYPRLVSCGGWRGGGGNDVNLVACANWWQLEQPGKVAMWPSPSSGAAVVRARCLCTELQPSPPLRPPGVDVGIKVICQSSLMPDLHLPVLHVNAGWLSSALQCEPSLDQGGFFFPSLSLTDFFAHEFSWLVQLIRGSFDASAAQLGSVTMRLRGRRRVNIGHLPILWHQLTLRTN